MRFKTVTEYMVMQSHKGANGTYFDAWSWIEETDIIKAIQIAQKNVYNGETLGQVKEIKLVQYSFEDMEEQTIICNKCSGTGAEYYVNHGHGEDSIEPIKCTSCYGFGRVFS